MLIIATLIAWNLNWMFRKCAEKYKKCVESRQSVLIIKNVWQTVLELEKVFRDMRKYV